MCVHVCICECVVHFSQVCMRVSTYMCTYNMNVLVCIFFDLFGHFFFFADLFFSYIPPGKRSGCRVCGPAEVRRRFD